MISRSPRCTVGAPASCRRGGAAGAPGGGGRWRCGGGGAGRRFDAQRAQARERFAQAAVAFGDQKRQAEHAAPRLPFGDDVVAFGRGKQRQRQSGIAVFEHDGDRGRQSHRHALQPDRHAAKRRDRHVERHAHAAHRAPQHHALAMQSRRRAGVRRPPHRRLRNAQVERRGRAATRGPTRQRSCRLPFDAPKLGSRRAVAARLPQTMPERGRNRLKNTG